MPTPRPFPTIWFTASCRESSIVILGLTFAAWKNSSIIRRVFPPRSPSINFSPASVAALMNFSFANGCFGMSDGHDLVREQRFGGHIRVIDRQRNERDVKLAVHHLVNEPLACARRNGKFRVRKFFLQVLHDHRQLVHRKGA